MRPVLPIQGLVTHTRRVQNLYKRAVRNIEAWFDRREVARFYIICLRARFEKNRDIVDERIAKDLLAKGEKELFGKLHWHVKQFQCSPGGTAFEREVPPPDWVLDYWHPLEKAQYPDYFARREKRKIEYAKFWEDRYGGVSDKLPRMQQRIDDDS